MLEELFFYYLKHPGELGDLTRRRALTVGLPRAVCDYIAGMTDRYVALEHKRLLAHSDVTS